MMEARPIKFTPEQVELQRERREKLKEARLEMVSVIKDGTVGNALNLLELTDGRLDYIDSLLTLAIKQNRNDIVEAILKTEKGKALIKHHGTAYQAARAGNAEALKLLAQTQEGKEQFGPNKETLSGMQVLPINHAHSYVTVLTAAIRSQKEKTLECIEVILGTKEGLESLKRNPTSYDGHYLDPISAAAASTTPYKIMKALLQAPDGGLRYKMTFKQAISALNILGEKSEKDPDKTKYIEAANLILSQFDKVKFLTYKSDFDDRGLHNKSAQKWAKEYSKQKEALKKELTKEFVTLATTKNLTEEQVKSSKLNSILGFINKTHNTAPTTGEIGVVSNFKKFKSNSKSIAKYHDLKLTVLQKIQGIFTGKTEKEIKYNKIAKDTIDQLMSSPEGKKMVADNVSKKLQGTKSR